MVQPSNTLFSIARSVGSTVMELKRVNCIPDANNIDVDDVLFVPRLPSQPIQTGVPGGFGTTGILDQVIIIDGCAASGAQITSPIPGQRISGTFNVRGTASLDGDMFQFYKLEVRPNFTNIYNVIAILRTPVQDGILGQINADWFDDGLYWIRLMVVDRTGNYISPCEIPVFFE